MALTIERLADHKLAHAQQLTDRWLASLRNDHTRSAYQRDLAAFGEFTDHATLVAVTHLLSLRRNAANALVTDFKAVMLNKGKKPTSVNRTLSGLRSLVRFAAEDGYVEWELRVPNAPEPPREMPAASPALVLAAIAQSGGSGGHAIRNRCILQLLMTLGLQGSELVALDLCDVTDDLKKITVRTRQGVRSFEVPEGARWALREWCSKRGPEAGPLFLSRTGRRLDRVDCHRILRKLKEQSGEFRETLNPRRVRNMAARLALAATGNDVARVSALLGQGVRQTARYLKGNGPGNLPTLIADQLARPRP